MALRAIQFTRLLMGAATLAAYTQPFAQSTATRIEEGTLEEVVVSGEKVPGTGLIQAEQATKSRTTVSQEYLATQSAGQSVIQSLNLVPGVNFTSADPYGSAGGNLRMRSFDNARISLMLDGIQLNDSGNYAMYTNQQLDPEIIHSATVNLGTSDIDSPTASATGGTINLVTVMPKDNFGMKMKASGGSDGYWRAFVQADTGAFGPWDTKAFVTGSKQQYDKFKGPGELEKTQFNARIYQELNEEDFLSLAFHYNRNRNNFIRFPTKAEIATRGWDFDNDPTCTRPAAVAGTPQLEGTTSCTNYHNVRINPSDTGNIRGQSSFALTDSLRLTIDPAFQYTLANGGGYTLIPEGDPRLRGGTTAPGVDLNGDGDVLDTVGLYTPNTTNTRRYSVNSSLLWTINEFNLLRMGYTLDYAKHRQTGQFGFLQANGDPEDVFAGRKGTPVKTADGADLRGRDRYSVAKLNQVSLSYTGKMLDDKLHLNLGVRAPYFERELNQYCYTSVGAPTGTASVSAGTQYCTTQAPTATANASVVTFTGLNGGFLTPYTGNKKYDQILPNVGVSFEPWTDQMLYLSYAKGLSAPRTDNLYSIEILDVKTESTNSVELGYRYQREALTTTVALWKSDYKNRIVTSFNPDLGLSTDRNVGPVDLWGVDAAIGTEILDGLSLYASTSYINSEVQQNIQVNATTSVPTRGKQLVETPEWTFGSRLQYVLGPVTLGLQGKFVDDRFSTDANDEVAASYTTYDADVRYGFNAFGMPSSVQFNVINLTDKDYLGSISTSRFTITTPPAPAYSVGAPRTFQLTVESNF